MSNLKTLLSCSVTSSHNRIIIVMSNLLNFQTVSYPDSRAWGNRLGWRGRDRYSSMQTFAQVLLGYGGFCGWGGGSSPPPPQQAGIKHCFQIESRCKDSVK